MTKRSSPRWSTLAPDSASSTATPSRPPTLFSMRASSVLKAWSAAPCFFDGRAQPAPPPPPPAPTPPPHPKTPPFLFFSFPFSLSQQHNNPILYCPPRLPPCGAPPPPPPP